MVSELPSQDALRRMASRCLPPHQMPSRFRVVTDTTDFFKVDYDDVVLLNNTPYLIRHNAKELRFGLEDEVKFWVKRAIDLNDGSLKILKLVFFEKFIANIAGIAIECFRSPQKEARVLELVSGHPNFMHGFSAEDEEGNLIRVLEFIKGQPLSTFIERIASDHKDYFFNQFPEMLRSFIDCVEAIGFVHERGEKHGDIRRDHILIDGESGLYRWIDFDFNYRHGESIFGYDLFGLGNILIFMAGKGDVLVRDLKRKEHPSFHQLLSEDLNIVFENRLANLKKVFPYIPDSLNRILLHFSKGAQWFYEETGELLEDLMNASREL